MGRTISSALQVARHQIASDKAWLLFVQVNLKDGGFFRLVRNSRHLAGNGFKWQACGMAIELPAEDAEGSLGQLVLAIPNVSRIPMLYTEVDDQVSGQTLTCWLQHESALEVFEDGLSWTHTILRTRAREEAITLECGHPAQTQRIPFRRFDRIKFPDLLPSGGIALGTA